jgi:flagellar protein FlgJ
MTVASINGAGGQATAAATAGVDAAARTQQRAALEKAAHDFEAIFTRQLMASMRSASLGESIDGSSAVDQFQEMADANMADGLADHGGLGIAQLLLAQLDKG